MARRGTREGRRGGARAGLDEAAVLRAATALVDAEGYDTLTLARLAEALGVRTPSLYNHVTGLDGVRRGLALRGTEELRDRLTRAAIGKSGRAALLALADAYRQFAHEHPGLYAASLHAPAPEEIARVELSDAILGILHAALAPYRLSDEAETHAIRAFRSLAHGFVSLELAGGFGLPLALDSSFRVLVQMLNSGLEGLRDEAGAEGE